MAKRHRARRGSPLYVTPAFDLLPDSYGYVRQNFRLFALLYLFPLIIGLSNGFWVVDTDRHFTPDTLDAANAVGVPTLPAYSYGRLSVIFVFALAIAFVLKIMLQAATVKAVNGRPIKLKSLWAVVTKRWKQFFLLYLSVSVICTVWLVPAFLIRELPIEIICFIPSFYFLRRYFVAPYVLLDNPEMDFRLAMTISAELTSRDSYAVYSMMGVMLLFGLFGIVPFIGWIFAFALLFFYSCGPAIRYQELKKLA